MVAVLNDVILPEEVLEGGIRGKNQRMNQRSSNQAGFVQANIVWTQTLRRYELGFLPMLPSEWQLLEGLHEATEGGAYGFLMRDPKDSLVRAGEGLLQPRMTSQDAGTAGLGYGVNDHRLCKRYTSEGSTRTKDRRIARPIASTVVIKRGGVAVTIGAGAGQIAFNADTGTVTFVADTTEALTSITPGATTVLNFASGAGIVAALAVGDRVALAGLTGTADTALNNLSHAITAKGATSLTIATTTTGLAATGGTAYKFPQPSETLTWTGEFYVPVQFEGDDLEWEILASGTEEARILCGRSIVLVEVRE
jgi:uncharacterized protein (TIGR02217 family)